MTSQNIPDLATEEAEPDFTAQELKHIKILARRARYLQLQVDERPGDVNRRFELDATVWVFTELLGLNAPIPAPTVEMRKSICRPVDTSRSSFRGVR